MILKLKTMLQIWAPKANSCRAFLLAMYNTIDGMKHLLKLESQFEIDKDGKEKFNDANLDAATRVFDKDGKGKILYDSLAEYKKQMLAVLNPNAPDIAKNPILQKEVAKAQADFEKQLPLDLSVPAVTNRRSPFSRCCERLGNQLFSHDANHCGDHHPE